MNIKKHNLSKTNPSCTNTQCTAIHHLPGMSLSWVMPPPRCIHRGKPYTFASKFMSQILTFKITAQFQFLLSVNNGRHEILGVAY